MEEFKDFSRLLSNFPVLFKADLFFKDFSRKPSKFKYFSSLCEPWRNPDFDACTQLRCSLVEMFCYVHQKLMFDRKTDNNPF